MPKSNRKSDQSPHLVPNDHAKQYLGIDVGAVAERIDAEHKGINGMLCISVFGDCMVVPYYMPVLTSHKNGLLTIEHEPMQEAFPVKWEKRWWACVVTPSGHAQRLITSYPDKTSALAAIKTLGYKPIDPPKGVAASTYLAVANDDGTLPVKS